MAVSASIASIKNIIGYNKGGAKSGTRVSGGLAKDQALEPVPTVGFRVGYVRNTNRIKVHVIGARHLPAKVGNVPASSYTVKVKLFPGTKRCETEAKPESWPVYNHDFSFDLAVCIDKRTRRRQELSQILTASNFLVFTICAVDSAGKKRNIGAATWPLDHALFRHKPLSLSFGDNEELETPDIWRKAQEITSGIAAAKLTREAKNNQLEVSLCYNAGNAEEGECDTLTVTVTRLRWSIESTREYQQQNAQLYVKLNVLEDGVGSIKSCKTQRFPPSISVHFNAEKDNSVLTVPLPPVRRDHLVCQLSLCTRTRLGKKTLLGRVNIGPTVKNSAEHLEQALQSPGLCFTQWHSLTKEEVH